MSQKDHSARKSSFAGTLNQAKQVASGNRANSGENKLGLSSLVSGAVRFNAINRLQIHEIDLEEQPRKHFDPAGLEDLAFSIKELGQQQPITVRLKDDGRFELVSGERRYRAAKMIGLSTIDAIVREIAPEDQYMVALTENMHREGFNAVEETHGILEMLQHRYGLAREQAINELRDIYNTARSADGEPTERHQQIQDDFRKIGRFTVQSFVQNRLPLLNMPAVLLELVATGKLSERYARKLSRVKDENLLQDLIKAHLEDSVPFDQIEERIHAHLNPPVQTQDDGSPAGEVLVKEAKNIFNPRKLNKLPAEKRTRLQELLQEARNLLE